MQLLFCFSFSTSGLSVVQVETKNELFRGVICLATEVHDDDGLPDALQRLVLKGSQKYPNKVKVTEGKGGGKEIKGFGDGEGNQTGKKGKKKT